MNNRNRSSQRLRTMMRPRMILNFVFQTLTLILKMILKKNYMCPVRSINLSFIRVLFFNLLLKERELALLLQDNASILKPDKIPVTDGFGNPDSVSSSMMTSSSISSKQIDHQLTHDQRDIIRYQLSAVNKISILIDYLLLFSSSMFNC